MQSSVNGITTAVDIADSTFDGNRNGVLALAFGFGVTAVTRVSVRDSRAVGNTNYGFRADSNPACSVSLSVSNSLVSNNSNGIGGTNFGLKVWASGNTISNNGLGLFNDNGAVFESAGNNAVRNNGANNSGTITVIATQ